MADDTLDQLVRAPEAPTDVTALNAWMAAQLGRPLILVTLAPAAGDAATLTRWRSELALFPGVSLAEERSGEEPMAETLARVAQQDPDTLLVCADAIADERAAQSWRAAVLDAAEARNLFERTEIVLIGAGMTRAIARSRGFEDGFDTSAPLTDAVSILAREAVTRATYRRYGSSPPCYL